MHPYEKPKNTAKLQKKISRRTPYGREDCGFYLFPTSVRRRVLFMVQDAGKYDALPLAERDCHADGERAHFPDKQHTLR